MPSRYLALAGNCPILCAMAHMTIYCMIQESFMILDLVHVPDLCAASRAASADTTTATSSSFDMHACCWRHCCLHSQGQVKLCNGYMDHLQCHLTKPLFWGFTDGL